MRFLLLTAILVAMVSAREPKINVITLDSCIGPQASVVADPRPLKHKVVEVFKRLWANYPQKIKVFREKFTDDEWKSITDYMSEPGPAPPTISLQEKVVEVFMYFQTKHPKETESVRRLFTEDEWNEIKDFTSQRDEYPPLLLISSDGPAGEVQSWSMGVYNKEATHNNWPYYVNDRSNRYLFYDDNRAWRISSTLGGYSNIRSTVKGPGNLLLKAVGWEYWNGTAKDYFPDPKMIVTKLGERPQYPDKLTITSTGEAATHQSSRLGEYRRRLADQDYNKRPTYKSVEGDEFVFYSDYGKWLIGSVPNGTRGWISTVKSGLLHIPEKGWMYYDGKMWQEDPVLTVSYEGCTEDNVDYFGHDVGAHLDIGSEVDCRNLCQQNLKCKFWSWIKPSYNGQFGKEIRRKCHLKSSDAGRKVDQAGVVSGTRYCAGEWVQISTDDCWSKCGGKGGLCEDGCGSNGYCCRKGHDDCPKEAGEVSPDQHTCVKKTGEWVQISTDDCWSKCGEKGGLCEDGCGSNGYCCRKGHYDCPREAGEVSPDQHTCVKKTGTGCIQENNIDYGGNDLGSRGTWVDNVAGCNTLCLQTTSCTHWSVDVSDGFLCYLKTSDSGRAPKDGAISGNKCG